MDYEGGEEEGEVIRVGCEGMEVIDYEKYFWVLLAETSPMVAWSKYVLC